jgi:opacity protein-like surface antigen
MVSITVMLFLISFPALGAEKANYFAVKAGIYSPESDDLEDFDTGFNGELAIGRYFHPDLALELGVGYFETEATFQGSLPIVGDYREEVEISVIPVTLSAKGIYPINSVELFGEIGIGVYFSNGESNITFTGLGNIYIDDDDTPFGFQLGLGGNFNITQNVFLGLEGEYLWAGAEFEGYGIKLDADLDGFIVTGNLGFRF